MKSMKRPSKKRTPSPLQAKEGSSKKSASPRGEAPLRNKKSSTRAEKPTRGDRPTRGEKPVRGDRQAHAGKPVRGEKPARAEKPVRGDRPAHAGKPVRGEKPARSETFARGDRPARTEKPTRGDRPARAGKPVRGDRPARSETFARGDKPMRGDRPARSETFARGDKPMRGDRPARVSQKGRRGTARVQERPMRSKERPQHADRLQKGGERVRRDAGNRFDARDEQSAGDKPLRARGERSARTSQAATRSGTATGKRSAGFGERKAWGGRDAQPGAERGAREGGFAHREERSEKRAVSRGAERPTRFDRPAFFAEPDAYIDESASETKPEERPRKGGARSKQKPASEAVRTARLPYPKTPEPVSQLAAGMPHPGQWLLTTREGSEQDLVDELMIAKIVDPAPRVFAPGLVLSPKVPKREKRPVELSFARQGFEILTSVEAQGLDALANRLVRSLRNKLERAKTYGLHVWVPDTADTNPLSSMAEELENMLAARLAALLPNAKRVDDSSLRRLNSMPFAQVCLVHAEHAVAGVMHSNATPSLARGGRTRVRVTGEFPSRAARKLEEALAWLGVEPGAGDVCVDLGAAPGGWTYVLAERRARVIAIDPANLRPDILAKKGVRHLKESAFTYAPDEQVDWLFCDMAWRPLEAAALLAKWGRKRWARIMVANIKLPMTKKAEILARVRAILETEGEWKGLKIRQLYHDRDEVTLTAHKS